MILSLPAEEASKKAAFAWAGDSMGILVKQGWLGRSLRCETCWFLVKWQDQLSHEIEVTYDMWWTCVRCNLHYRHIRHVAFVWYKLYMCISIRYVYTPVLTVTIAKNAHRVMCVYTLIIRDHIILMHIEYVFNLQSFKRKKGASPRRQIIKCETMLNKTVFLLFSHDLSISIMESCLACLACLMA